MPVRNRAAKGRQREHRSKAFVLPVCQADHPTDVIFCRAAASHGVFDVIALCFRCQMVCCVQSKSRDWPWGQEAKELQRLGALVRNGIDRPRWDVYAFRWLHRASRPEMRAYQREGSYLTRA